MAHITALAINWAIDDEILSLMLAPYGDGFDPTIKYDYWNIGGISTGLLTCKAGAIEEGFALHGTVFGAKPNQSLDANKVDICRFDWLDLGATRLILLDKIDAIIDKDGWQDCRDESSKAWWAFLSDRIACIKPHEYLAIVDFHV